MFANITADDIFRLETKRLWLRWPRASDAPAITGFVGLAEVAQMTATIPHPYPAGEAERFVLKSRADNILRRALVLALVPKNAPHQVIGLVSATPADQAEGSDFEIGYVVTPSLWGRGFASEAVSVLVASVFGLTGAGRIRANVRVSNPASRRVLEKCGFVHLSTGLDSLPARGGLHPCDRFAVERATWPRARAGARLPPMAQQPISKEMTKLKPTPATA